MAQQQLPDRRIDVQIPAVLRELDSPREIDRAILEELVERPLTTGHLAGQIGEQAGYVTQRLRVLVDEDVLVQLDRGFYEVHSRVVHDE
jgi:hypothetical protein